MTVRVLRLMEYIYKDAETAIADQERWVVKSSCSYKPNTRVTIRSAVLPMAFETEVEKPANMLEHREPQCVEAWPECWPGEYNPKCCRFPKSCSVGFVSND